MHISIWNQLLRASLPVVDAGGGTADLREVEEEPPILLHFTDAQRKGWVILPLPIITLRSQFSTLTAVTVPANANLGNI